MAFYLAAFGLLLHILLCGLGLTWLTTPRRWRAFWPVFVGPMGIALQSAIVWAGAYTPWRGTNVYAAWAEILPALLLAAGAWQLGARGRARLWEDFRKFNALWLTMAVTLNVLIIPLAVSSKVLTTSSLGSCDAADYAAGARVLQEFSRGERGGFLGLTEVVQVASVDNFFDFWLRLNHFTPSAIVAFNAAVFQYQPYQIIGVVTALLLVLSLPLVYWLARAGLRYSPRSSIFVALIYGLSPLMWYAVFQVAMGQLIAAPAIALLTWSGLVLWRSGAKWRVGASLAGLLATGYWLILGSYNFILIVCLVPALAYAGGHALWKGQIRQFLRWFMLMLIPLVIVSFAFMERALGLVERFRLFRQFDFGWKIPALSPEGWLGMLADNSLKGFGPTLRWSLSLGVLTILIFSLVRAAKLRRSNVFLACCLTLPILAGYVFLLIRGQVHATNASYDAYKLFCVFYPGLLGSFCYWLTLLRSSSPLVRAAGFLFAATVLGLNASAASRFARQMESPPLIVDRSLVEVQRIEKVDAIDSINVLVADFWTRLWANSFLLRKPQYFLTHTYEGRRNTALKGRWDLLHGLLTVRLPDEDPVRAKWKLPASYSILDTQSPYFLRARVETGWYDMERLPHSGSHWRWTGGDASLFIDNPQARPLNVAFHFNARSIVERDLQIWIRGKRLRTVQIGRNLRVVRVPPVLIPPGGTAVELRSSAPPVTANLQDNRPLGFAAYGIVLEVLPDAEDNAP